MIYQPQPAVFRDSLRMILCLVISNEQPSLLEISDVRVNELN